MWCGVGRGWRNKEGEFGVQLLEKVRKKLRQFLEPAKARVKKPLKIPDERKKRRGGKRQRRLKEKYGLSDLHKERIAFGRGDTEYGDSAMGKRSFASDGSGKLRQSKKARRKQGLTNKMRRTLESSQQQRGKSALLN